MTKLKTETRLTPDGLKTAYAMHRLWEVQSPPYRSPLNFQYNRAEMSGSFTTAEGFTSYYFIEQIKVGSHGDRSVDAKNLCYSRLVNQLGSPSQMANNVLEAHQSVSALVARVSQLSSFVSSLKKGNFTKAAKTLGTPVPNGLKGSRGVAKSLGDQFLEYHFGWEPLIKDIHDSASTLTKTQFTLRPVHASARVRDQFTDRIESGHPGNNHDLTVQNYNVVFSCKMGCFVKVTNPNVFLANQLGLLNPAAIAWEAVPFSFVADWFGNVGQVLGSMSDFAGLSIQTPYTTSSTEISMGGFTQHEELLNPIHNGFGTFYGTLIKVERGPGISLPSLRIKPLAPLSIARGVTAISLLLQKLKR